MAGSALRRLMAEYKRKEKLIPDSTNQPNSLQYRLSSCRTYIEPTWRNCGWTNQWGKLLWMGGFNYVSETTIWWNMSNVHMHVELLATESVNSPHYQILPQSGDLKELASKEVLSQQNWSSHQTTLLVLLRCNLLVKCFIQTVSCSIAENFIHWNVYKVLMNCFILHKFIGCI